MKVPYRDLRVTSEELRVDLLDAVDRVLRHGRLLLGPEVEHFEEMVAAACHRRFAVGVGSGTQALYLALRALEVGPGDEVVTTPMSWISTMNAIVLTGARPVFADIRHDLNIDPEKIIEAVTPDTKVILPVHFTGRMCQMAQIMDIAHSEGLHVVEDAAQAFGAMQNDKPAGSYGHLGCFSMNTMKMFSSYGEAGAIVLNDRTLCDRLLSLRYNGTVNKEDCHEVGINARIDTLQAAMMIGAFPYLEAKTAAFIAAAARYTTELSDLVDCPPLDGSHHIYYTYTITTPHRDLLHNFLVEHGIESKIYHPILMPYHTAYRNKYLGLDIPVATKMVKRILCLPNHDQLSDDQISYVIETIKKFFDDRKMQRNSVIT